MTPFEEGLLGHNRFSVRLLPSFYLVSFIFATEPRELPGGGLPLVYHRGRPYPHRPGIVSAPRLDRRAGTLPAGRHSGADPFPHQTGSGHPDARTPSSGRCSVLLGGGRLGVWWPSGPAHLVGSPSVSVCGSGALR